MRLGGFGRGGHSKVRGFATRGPAHIIRQSREYSGRVIGGGEDGWLGATPWYRRPVVYCCTQRRNRDQRGWHASSSQALGCALHYLFKFLVYGIVSSQGTWCQGGLKPHNKSNSNSNSKTRLVSTGKRGQWWQQTRHTIRDKEMCTQRNHTALAEQQQQATSVVWVYHVADVGAKGGRGGRCQNRVCSCSRLPLLNCAFNGGVGVTFNCTRCLGVAQDGLAHVVTAKLKELATSVKHNHGYLTVAQGRQLVGFLEDACLAFVECHLLGWDNVISSGQLAVSRRCLLFQTLRAWWSSKGLITIFLRPGPRPAPTSLRSMMASHGRGRPR